MKLLVPKNKERMIKKKRKKKRKKKAGDLGQSSSPSTTPPLHSTQTHTPLCLRDTPPRLTPPSRLTSLIMSLGPGVLDSRGRLALLPPLSARASLPRLALARSAIPFSPMLQRAGTKVARRRKLLNRLQLICQFCSPLLEAA